MILTAGILCDALRRMHPADKGWIFLDECRNGTGFGGDKEQRFDAWAINAWRGKEVPQLRRAFEIKVSSGDLLNELRSPDKRWAAKSVSHQFFWVAPAGLILPSKIERDEGLIEWDGSDLKVTRAAHTRATLAPKWTFVASALRQMNEVLERRDAQIRALRAMIAEKGGSS